MEDRESGREQKNEIEYYVVDSIFLPDHQIAHIRLP